MVQGHRWPRRGLGDAAQGSFCDYAARERSVFYLPDTLQDPRFSDDPLVAGPPHVRFYAGAPLFVGDTVAGTLCVLDTRPRYLDDDTLLRLRDLANCLQEALAQRLDGRSPRPVAGGCVLAGA